MKIEDFKAGNYLQQYKYKCFIPSKINHPFSWDDPELSVLLSEANKKLEELNSFSSSVPDIENVLPLFIAKESLASSKIEGIKTEFKELLLSESEIAPDKKEDWLEVKNYIEAINICLEEMNEIPLSTRILNLAHQIIFSGARGEKKSPGEFRKSQNWVGGATINEAIYIPPVHDEISNLIGDLENFLHNDYLEIPDLIKIAIAHYQFITIHPYVDGNGRIGRLLITLYLVSFGLLSKPTLYLSAFFEKRKIPYYNHLMLVRKNDDLMQWIKFFLEAVIESALHGIKTFQSIIESQKEIDAEVIPAIVENENDVFVFRKYFKLFE
ncbi:MAG: Fic family protein [Melioribacteraceae bacterium]|nr:Fic family protein [Melioribacteraceae bacterium]